MSAAAERLHVSRMPKNDRKKMKRQMRELATLAYERELGNHLSKLQRNFSEWGAHKITAFELSDRIHEFHNGPSRELFKTYDLPKPDFLVVRAVVLGILTEEEVPAEILEFLSGQIQSLRSLAEDNGTG